MNMYIDWILNEFPENKTLSFHMDKVYDNFKFIFYINYFLFKISVNLI